MKRGLLVVGLLMILTLLIACSPAAAPKTGESNVNSEPAEIVKANPSSDNTIRITAAGFEPKTLTVKVGTTVTFFNEDSSKHWPASAVHPTHTAYPGSDIKKCGSGEVIFDACKGLEQGESFSFTFNEKGSWGYHDHLRASMTGKIVVG
ncbi:MAG TPA: plastocyanin/azurin family copper-binding protein [Candidatus Nanoarchaeia archaeon]|nr:plastocyanin/azurin family copper-binding protein [Candidatus Nanoarchaeia archaeon]